jgi:hypothetical protein
MYEKKGGSIDINRYFFVKRNGVTFEKWTFLKMSNFEYLDFSFAKS